MYNTTPYVPLVGIKRRNRELYQEDSYESTQGFPPYRDSCQASAGGGRADPQSLRPQEAGHTENWITKRRQQLTGSRPATKYQPYPNQPNQSAVTDEDDYPSGSCCTTVNKYKILPDFIPVDGGWSEGNQEALREGAVARSWNRSRTNRGPTSIKSLYTGMPNYYPMLTIERPQNSLYGADLGTIPPQLGDNQHRETYQYKVYPLTDRNIRERRPYSSDIIPYPTILDWQHVPVVEEGTTEYLRARD